MAQISDDIRRHLADLYSQPGVSGSCLQTGDLVVLHDLPYSDDRIASLAARVDHLMASYDSVGRQIWQLCAGFENFWLMILCRNKTRLLLLLKANADLDLIAGRATRLLMDVEAPLSRESGATSLPPPGFAARPASPPVTAEPTPAATPINGSHASIPMDDFERMVSNLLSRVTGQSQASKLIDRVLSKESGLGSSLSITDARRIGISILDFIPNRGKRDALAAELLNNLNS